MESTMLLETYLKQLRLPTFLHNYGKFAEDAARANLSYDRYLLALAEQEVAQRDENRKIRRIKGARLPVLKELADFDFSCVPSLSKQRVPELARGEYLSKVKVLFEAIGTSHRHRCGSNFDKPRECDYNEPAEVLCEGTGGQADDRRAAIPIPGRITPRRRSRCGSH